MSKASRKISARRNARSYFERARMRDRYSSMRMEKSSRESAQVPDVEGYIEAWDEVRAVMTMLGSNMKPVVWDSCGNGVSLRQHVGRVAGRSVPEPGAGSYLASISWPGTGARAMGE